MSPEIDADLAIVRQREPPLLKDATEPVNDALPNSRIASFEEHGHEAMLTAPDRFIEEVLAFIRETN
ncbi:alpha/beta fold hydrolase [Halorussus salinisoli]|uniref:alpha/beta fold hydrolase n=1 Tax=Halorussus salinisoli TaxID=2558242 RepID=UPI002A9205B8|nr:hypothetical protein [Halorussus salinisoli]